MSGNENRWNVDREVTLEQLRHLIEKGVPHFEGATNALSAVRLIDAGATTTEVADEIRKSPALSEGVRRLASSARYGHQKIRSVTSAVEFLGYEELRRVMLSLAITAWSQRCSTSALFEPDFFRRRSLTLAFLCEDIALRLRVPHPSKYFLVGMFADIGYMSLVVHMPSRLTHARDAAGPPLRVPALEAERRNLGCTHAEVSAIVAEVFGLDLEVALAIGFHHTPDLAAGDVQSLADVVHVAGAAADANNVLPLRHWPLPEVDHTSYGRLGLEQDAATELFQQSLVKADLVLSAMKVKLVA